MPPTSLSLASFVSPSSGNVSPSSDGAGPTRSYLDVQSPCGTAYSAEPSSASGGQSQSASDAQVELPSGASSPTGPCIVSPGAVNSSKSSTTDTCVQSSSVTKVTESQLSQPSLPDAPAGRWRVPIHTCFIKRYERKYKIPKQNTLSVIPPMTTHFPHLTDGGCGNWVRVTHPEGGLYFYDAERRIFTDAYVYEPAVAEEVEQFVLHINEIVKLQSKLLPPNHELVLEIEPSAWDTGETLWGYYYIDHDTRSQFWLEEFDNSYLTWELSGVASFSHIKHEVECQYWRHWSLFPIGPRQFPEEICEELLGILTHNAIDALTSPTSTTPYDVETLLRTISLVKNCTVGGPGRGYLACGFSRVMGDFCWF
ncbi:hypothetical protein EWM64_g8648 [Hericium alpestre]|uniref:WW domain-containing protein n=1 Tax=Hericium alpestre TaxID=135208 RepID=A0A4Y9ZMQ7_9AGAM|nr:hypothetical protein EWM64_g8648 [Hericium alpestre]